MTKPHKLTRIGVMGTTYRLSWSGADLTPEAIGSWGETCSERKRITVNEEKHLAEGMSPEGTLLHECIHAVLGESGHTEYFDEKQEEGLVRALEAGLHPIICRLVKAGYFRTKQGTN